MNNNQKQFLAKLCRLSSKHNSYEIFIDFINYAYNRLNKYTLYNYKKPIRVKYSDLSDYYFELLLLLEKGLVDLNCDFLGDIFNELSLTDKKNLGQCFTPFYLSYACAKMILADASNILEKKGSLVISEPAAGTGSMIIATFKYLQELNIDTMKVYFQAVELSQTTYRALAVQLNMIGCKAVVINGNTLSLKKYDHTCTQGLLYLTSNWEGFRDSCLKDFGGI